MAGIITLKCSVIKNGIEKFALKQPIFLPSPVDPLYASQVIFEGISVEINGDGKQHNMDTTVAFKVSTFNLLFRSPSRILPSRSSKAQSSYLDY